MAEDRFDLSRVDIRRIIERDTELRYVAHTNGGEWAGPCPFCGTGDDRFRVWPDHPDGRGRYWCRVCDRHGDAIDYLRERDHLSYQQAVEELRRHGADVPYPAREQRARPSKRLTPVDKTETPDRSGGQRYSRRETVARYTYVDEDGIPLFQVRRIHYYDENGQRVDKQFYQYRWEDGQWQRGLKNTRRVIYRLPRVLAAVEAGETVFVVEGEKSVHALEDVGLTATCNPMGAKKWKPGYSTHFQGAHVVVLPDADDDGLEHADRVAASLIAVAESVKVVSLPGLDYAPTHGPDVVDWLADPANTLDGLLALVEQSELWRPRAYHDEPPGDLFPDDADYSEYEADPLDCPPLPPEISLGGGDADSDGVLPPGSWLDDYVSYAQQTSPMTPALFHEAAGLWVASTVIARRLRLPMAFDDIFPNLYIGWVATTTLWNKTTALNIARRLAWDTIPHLLAPEETTHEGLISAMAGEKPANLNEANPELSDQLKRWEKSRQYAAQKGWMLDEMSGLLASAGKDYNAGLLEALLRFFDCTPLYRRLTKGSGYTEIRGAYLSFIGGSTPAALSDHLVDEKLWSNGWWPRFAMLSPEEDFPRQYKRAVEVERPAFLANKLIQLDRALPEGEWPDPPDHVDVLFEKDAYDLWEDYSKVMRYDLLVAAVQGDIELDERLFGTYGRLPVQALKVAAILTALDWSGAGEIRITLPHMRRALRIVERWRASVHRTLKHITQSEYDRIRVRILKQIGKRHPKGATFRDICKGMRDVSPERIRHTLWQMEDAGDIVRYDYQHPKGGRPTERYVITGARHNGHKAHDAHEDVEAVHAEGPDNGGDFPPGGGRGYGSGGKPAPGGSPGKGSGPPD